MPLLLKKAIAFAYWTSFCMVMSSYLTNTLTSFEAIFVARCCKKSS